MNEFADFIKEKLDTVLAEMQEYSWLFVNNPDKGFTKKRKLDFKEMISILLSMGGSSLKLELMKYFSYEEETATSSAFVQQREKILKYCALRQILSAWEEINQIRFHYCLYLLHV